MLTVTGAPALSAFRLQKLKDQLAQLLGGPVEVFAEFVHLVEADGGLSDDERGVLERLLQYGPSAERLAVSGEEFFVAPRPGTISPWSSKATDIAHNSGLQQILRIERGIRYVVGGAALDDDQRAQIRALIHDRMVEAVFPSVEAVLFY